MKHVIKSNTNIDNTTENLNLIINNLKECKEYINGIYYEIGNQEYEEVDELYDSIDLSITKAKTLYAKLKN